MSIRHPANRPPSRPTAAAAGLALAAALALAALPVQAATDAQGHQPAPAAKAAPVSAAAGHDHGAATGEPASAHRLVLDNGRKWATDVPLRQGMDGIRTAMASRIPAIHAGELKAADYQALGGEVEARVADIVGNCKLSPEADAVLHVVVADLLAGADQMKSGKDAAAGAHKVVVAANDYARYFDHPGWKPLR